MSRTFTRRQLKRYLRRAFGISLWDKFRLRFSPVFRSYRKARREADRERRRWQRELALRGGYSAGPKKVSDLDPPPKTKGLGT